LTLAQYNIAEDDPSKGRANMAGINAAIMAYFGTRAPLVLPSGAIYVDQANGTDNWSIATLRGDAETAGQLWGRAHRVLEDSGEQFRDRDLESHKRIVASVENESPFRSGYEKGVALEARSLTEAAAS
jgi:hypothetical protein